MLVEDGGAFGEWLLLDIAIMGNSGTDAVPNICAAE